VIRLGDPQPTNLSPLYRRQVLVHGLGFSPDRKTLAVVSIASNSVTFIDTASNKIKQIEPIARFTTNPAGSQIVIAVGPIRQIVDPTLGGSDERRYLTVMTVENGAAARPVSSASTRSNRSHAEREPSPQEHTFV